MSKWKVTLKVEVPDRCWTREVSQDFDNYANLRWELLDDFEIMLQKIHDEINGLKE